MKLICVGDSLTFGNVGYSYIHFFNKKIHAVNKGKTVLVITHDEELIAECCDYRLNLNEL